MSKKIEKILLGAPGLFRTLASILGGAAIIIPEIAPSLLVDPKQLFTVSGALGLIGVVRAALRKLP